MSNVNNLSAFFATSMDSVSNEFVEVTKRAKDKDGNPIPWEIKAIPDDRITQIRKECTTKKKAKRGQYTNELDEGKFNLRLCAACVVFPNLNDAELQDSYGVKSAESLLSAMLVSGELLTLSEAVMKINGYDMDFEEEVDTAKN